MVVYSIPSKKSSSGIATILLFPLPVRLYWGLPLPHNRTCTGLDVLLSTWGMKFRHSTNLERHQPRPELEATDQDALQGLFMSPSGF